LNGLAAENDEAKIFKSLSSPNRITILKHLSKHPLTYTELFKALGFTKKTGSGKFAHHMRLLISAGLIRFNEKTKTYELTGRGIQVVKSLDTIKEAINVYERMKVRKSALLIERFDRNKIATVLVEEAGVPPKTADKIAKMAEEKLETLRVEYLTGPLIRELVNALLIDQGLEGYRQRLTRLGMPVYDVEKMLENTSNHKSAKKLVKEAAKSIFKEYVLLTALPRDAVDAYLSAEIDLEAVETWAFSIYAKSYSLQQDVIEQVLAEADTVEKEVLIKFDDNKDKDLNNVLRLLTKSLTSVTFYCENPEEVNRVIGLGGWIIFPMGKTLDVLSTRAELIISPRISCSAGHPFSPTGLIEGKASINLVGLYLKASCSEKSFYDNLSTAVELVQRAFKKKKEMISRFWEGVEGWFILSFVGVQELVKNAGLTKEKLVKQIWEICKDLSSDELIIQPSGQSSSQAAERFLKSDVKKYGVKEVKQFLESDTYSWSLYFENSGELLNMLRYLPGGVVIPFRRDMVKDFLNMRCWALLPPSSKQ